MEHGISFDNGEKYSQWVLLVELSKERDMVSCDFNQSIESIKMKAYCEQSATDTDSIFSSSFSYKPPDHSKWNSRIRNKYQREKKEWKIININRLFPFDAMKNTEFNGVVSTIYQKKNCQFYLFN